MCDVESPVSDLGCTCDPSTKANFEYFLFWMQMILLHFKVDLYFESEPGMRFPPPFSYRFSEVVANPVIEQIAAALLQAGGGKSGHDMTAHRPRLVDVTADTTFPGCSPQPLHAESGGWRWQTQIVNNHFPSCATLSLRLPRSLPLILCVCVCVCVCVS